MIDGPCHYCGQPANACIGDGKGGIVRYYHAAPLCPEAKAAFDAYWASPEGQRASAAEGLALARACDREVGGGPAWYDPHLGVHALAREERPILGGAA